ncbi:glutaredoxin domain-containing protein [Microbacterium sp. 69-7]|uniref:glutaredoxin domain-containing protein n=1 Tax=Microbacterium sp. 69-7 TaxID=1895784 RepID=UPI000B1E23B5|nr:glutaredoxin domain-containing protein [Microbacterium sp. 69-7]
MSLEATVYTKTGTYCGQCVTTIRALEKAEIPFEEVPGIDLPENANLLQMFKDRGLTSAPIVFVKIWDTDKSYDMYAWAGFRPDKIAWLSGLIKEAA